MQKMMFDFSDNTDGFESLGQEFDLPPYAQGATICYIANFNLTEDGFLESVATYEGMSYLSNKDAHNPLKGKVVAMNRAMAEMPLGSIDRDILDTAMEMEAALQSQMVDNKNPICL